MLLFLFIYLCLHIKRATYHQMLGSYFALFSARCIKYEEYTNNGGDTSQID